MESNYKFNPETDHLSYSSLKHFDKSPASFVKYKTDPFVPTAAMNLGTVIDCLLLEPKKAKKTFVCDEGIICQIGGVKPRATNRYKDWLNSQPDDILIVPKKDLDEAKKIVNVLKTNEVSKEYFSRIRPDSKDVQVEFTFTHAVTGLKVRGKMDAQSKTSTRVRFMTELKTGETAHPKKFRKKIFDQGYDIQIGAYDAYYQTLFEKPDLFFIPIETEAPYNISVLKITEDFRTYCRNRFERLMIEFARCVDQDLFGSSYEFRSMNGHFDLELPNYLKSDL